MFEFHLRQLGRFGLAEQAPSERIMSTRGDCGRCVRSWSTEPTGEQARDDAAQALNAVFVDRETDAVRRWSRASAQAPKAWQRAASMTGILTWLTPDELEYGAAVPALGEKYVERIEHADRRRQVPGRFGCSASASRCWNWTSVDALRDPRLRRLAAGHALSSFGDSALYLVLAIWVKDLTGSNGAAGAVFFALGAMSLLAPAGCPWSTGSAADSVLGMATDAVAAAVVLLLLLVHSRADLWLIYAVAAGYGLSCTIVGPASSAVLKDLLADADLGSANASRQTANQGLRLLSPLVGAGLYAAVGGGCVAVFDAATFLASIGAVAGVRLVESPPSSPVERPSLRCEVSAGFAHLRATPLLRRISVTAGAAMLGLGLFESIDFAVVAGLGHRPSFFGVLVSVQGGGSILGGVVVAAAMRRLGEGTVVALSFVAFAVSAVGLIVHSLAVVLGSFVLLGIAVSWFAVGLGTAMQRLTPPRLQGRVSAAGYVLTDVPQTVSIACGAVLISVVDFRTLLGLLAAVTLACGVGLLVVLATDERRLLDDQVVVSGVVSEQLGERDAQFGPRPSRHGSGVEHAGTPR